MKDWDWDFVLNLSESDYPIKTRYSGWLLSILDLVKSFNLFFANLVAECGALILSS